MRHDARHRVVDPVDARPDLAQGVEQDEPLGPGPREHRARGVKPADRQPHEDRARGLQPVQKGPQIGRDHPVGQLQRRMRGRVRLSPEIPAQRAEALRAQRRGDHRLPRLGRAGQRVDENEGRGAGAGSGMMAVMERVGLRQRKRHGPPVCRLPNGEGMRRAGGPQPAGPGKAPRKCHTLLSRPWFLWTGPRCPGYRLGLKGRQQP